jgi:hypothetical protein
MTFRCPHCGQKVEVENASMQSNAQMRANFRRIRAAYIAMWEHHKTGTQPQAIAIGG